MEGETVCLYLQPFLSSRALVSPSKTVIPFDGSPDARFKWPQFELEKKLQFPIFVRRPQSWPAFVCICVHLCALFRNCSNLQISRSKSKLHLDQTFDPNSKFRAKSQAEAQARQCNELELSQAHSSSETVLARPNLSCSLGSQKEALRKPKESSVNPFGRLLLLGEQKLSPKSVSWSIGRAPRATRPSWPPRKKLRLCLWPRASP